MGTCPEIGKYVWARAFSITISTVAHAHFIRSTIFIHVLSGITEHFKSDKRLKSKQNEKCEHDNSDRQAIELPSLCSAIC